MSHAGSRPDRPGAPAEGQANEQGLARLNALPRPALEAELGGCLGVARWAREVAGGQPYASAEQLRAAADAAARTLSDTEVDEALAGHPRIGERPEGPAASHSRAEQAGVDHDDQELAAALRAGNRAYEGQFGHIFLICASGLTGQEMLGELRHRLGNDAETERGVVATELRKIMLLRLDGLVHPSRTS